MMENKMKDKELEIRESVETIGMSNLRFDWNMDTIVIAFTEFEDPQKGLEKTVEYWEEFLKSELYEEYWKQYREKGKYCNWDYHLTDVMNLFKTFVFDKRKNERKN